MAGNAEGESVLGFVSVSVSKDPCYSGGLLVLDLVGRPVEFHCTVPISPNRAQEILYGKSLRQFVFCDQIGKALIEKAQKRPLLYLTDSLELLGLSHSVVTPILCIQHQDESHIPGAISNDPIKQWTFRDRKYFYTGGFDPAEQCADTLNQFHLLADVDEPFERINEALSHAKVAA